MILFIRRVLSAAADTRWWFLILITVAHFAVAWAGLAALGEQDLTGSAFIYYYITTVTTVGYGDISPSTEAGRIFAAVWLMVVGIALFAAVLGKAVAGVSAQWRRRLEGDGDYSDIAGATVIIGYREGRTPKLLEELIEGQDAEDVIILTTKQVRTPPDVRLVRADRLTDADALERAGGKKAARLIMFADDDDLTLSACLAAGSINPSSHKVAYFNDSESASLARRHCPGLETVSADIEGLVARATKDPGASAVLSALVSAQDDDGALFSAPAAQFGAPASVAALGEKLRAQRASLVAIADGPNAPPDLCLGGDQNVPAEATVFYVARDRLS